MVLINNLIWYIMVMKRDFLNVTLRLQWCAVIKLPTSSYSWDSLYSNFDWMWICHRYSTISFFSFLQAREWWLIWRMGATLCAVCNYSDLGWWSYSELFREHLQEVYFHESWPESSTSVGWTQVAHVCACTIGQTETLTYSYFLPIPVTFCNPLMLAATNPCNICSTLSVINSLENLNVLLPGILFVKLSARITVRLCLQTT